MSSSAEMASKSSRELREMLNTLRKELVAHVFESRAAGGSVSGSKRSAIRKEIARVLTVLSWRRIKGIDV